MKKVTFPILAISILCACTNQTQNSATSNKQAEENRKISSAVNQTETKAVKSEPRIIWDQYEGRGSFIDSEENTAFICNKEKNVPTFSLIPKLSANKAKICMDEFICEADFGGFYITFQSTSGEIIKTEISSRKTALGNWIRFIMLADTAFGWRNPCVFESAEVHPNDLTNFLYSKPIEKIMFETMDESQWIVQGVSNPNFFIEL